MNMVLFPIHNSSGSWLELELAWLGLVKLPRAKNRTKIKIAPIFLREAILAVPVEVGW